MLVLFLRVCKMVEDGGWEIQFFNFPTRPKKRWTVIKFWIHYLTDGVKCAARPIDRQALYSVQARQSQYSVQWSSSRIFVFLFQLELDRAKFLELWAGSEISNRAQSLIVLSIIFFWACQASEKLLGSVGGKALHRGNVCASHPAILGSILGVPKFFQLKNLMLLRFINSGTAKRVDRGKSWSSTSSCQALKKKLWALFEPGE